MERFNPQQARELADVAAVNTICRALVLSKGDISLAQRQSRDARTLQGYGADVIASATALITRANVLGELDPSNTSPTSVLMRRALAASVVGQLPNAVKVPFHSSGKGLILAGSASFIEEGHSIPLVAADFFDLAHEQKKVAAIAVFSREASENVGENDASFSSELTRLLYVAINARFSGNAAASASAPAGVANGSGSVASTGATVSAMQKDFSDAIRIVADTGGFVPDCWLLSPAAAASVRLLKVADASGETLAGLPILTGVGVVGVTLLASSRIAVSVGDRVALTASAHGDVRMVDTNPAGEVITPTASEHTISMFQTNAVAMRAALAANWTVDSPSTSVVSVTGCAYD